MLSRPNGGRWELIVPASLAWGPCLILLFVGDRHLGHLVNDVFLTPTVVLPRAALPLDGRFRQGIQPKLVSRAASCVAGFAVMGRQVVVVGCLVRPVLAADISVQGAEGRDRNADHGHGELGVCPNCGLCGVVCFVLAPSTT